MRPVWAVVLLGCTGVAADHETVGDRAYAEGRYREALVEYRLALVQSAPDPDVRAKAAVAALEVSDFAAAAREYGALAAEGGAERVEEAADGLVRVARAALSAGDQDGVAAALNGLQEVAPGRAAGQLVHRFVRATGRVPSSAEGLALLRYAAAGAPDARSQDSLMFAYARLLSRLGRCEDAMPVYESLVRRRREPAVMPESREGAALCALKLGRQALDGGQPTVAEEWFRRAVQGEEETPAVRAAYIGLGDVQFARGDYLSAADAYERARAGLAFTDSLYTVATERLNMLGRIQ